MICVPHGLQYALWGLSRTSQKATLLCNTQAGPTMPYTFLPLFCFQLSEMALYCPFYESPSLRRQPFPGRHVSHTEFVL